jgi:hypothetical protein
MVMNLLNKGKFGYARRHCTPLFFGRPGRLQHARVLQRHRHNDVPEQAIRKQSLDFAR